MMRSQRVVSRRRWQQVREIVGGLLSLVKTIFVNGVMVMLAPVLAPVALAVQLWDALPTWRQVRRSVPTSCGEVRRLPRSLWSSVPSVAQAVDMLARLVQAAARDYMAHFSSSQGLANATRPQPVQPSF